MPVKKENDYEMLQKYAGLLETVDEAFAYIDECYREGQSAHIDRVFGDMISAFMQFEQAHVTMRTVFEDDQKLMTEISRFTMIVSLLEELEHYFDDEDKKQAFITGTLSREYKNWKNTMAETVKKYIVH